jgi:hypothetical protein
VVVVVQDVEPVAGDRLLRGEALKALPDLRLGNSACVVAVLAGVKSTLGRELLYPYSSEIIGELVLSE